MVCIADDFYRVARPLFLSWFCQVANFLSRFWKQRHLGYSEGRQYPCLAMPLSITVFCHWTSVQSSRLRSGCFVLAGMFAHHSPSTFSVRHLCNKCQKNKNAWGRLGALVLRILRLQGRFAKNPILLDQASIMRVVYQRSQKLVQMVVVVLLTNTCSLYDTPNTNQDL